MEMLLNPLNQPLNALEEAILAAKENKITRKELLLMAMENDFYLICAENSLGSQETIQPLYWMTEEQNYLCAFTSQEHADRHRCQQAASVKLHAKTIFALIPEHCGFAINPNQAAPIKFSASEIRNVFKNFAQL